MSSLVWAVALLAGQAPPEPQTHAFGGAGGALLEARGLQSTQGGTFGAGFGVESLGEDVYLQLGLSLDVDLGSFAFGLQLPVRLRIVDNDPSNDGDLLGIVREEDWDSVADVLKILRFVSVGQRGGDYYARVGALEDATLGHGTIVHRYRNDVDVNRWRVGLDLEGRISGLGGHVFIGDLTQPYLVGARAFARPFELAFGSGPWANFEVGTSVVVDAEAPRALCYRDADADRGCASRRQVVADMGDPSIPVDDQQRPLVRRSEPVAVIGMDVGYRLLDLDVASITPYVDINKVSAVEDGYGLHAGVLWQLGVPVVVDQLVLDLRTEYRHVSADYRGPYFSGVYEIERYTSLRARPTAAGVPTRLGYLCGTEDGPCTGGGPARNGVFLELLAGLPKYVFLGGELLDYDGEADDGTFRLSLEIPALQVLRVSAMYFRVGVRDTGDLFAIDDRSAVLAAAEVPVGYGFTVRGRFLRLWQGDTRSGYRPVDDWQFGVGFSVPL